MASRLPELSATLRINPKPFVEGAKLAQDAIDDIINRFVDLSGLLRRLSNITLGLGTSVAVSMAPGVLAATRFEAAMADVEAVADATAGEMTRLRGTVQDLAVRGLGGPVELADAMANLASTSLTAVEVMEVLPVVAQTARTGFISLGEASELLVSVMSAYNLEASEAARIGNTLAAANAVSSADIARLAEAYKHVAPVARTANVTLEETTAALSILIDVVQNGEIAGTGLRNVLTRLANSTPDLEEAVKKVGLTVRDVNPGVVGLATALQNLDIVLKGGGSAFQIFGDRGQNAASILANAAGSFAEYQEGVTGTNALLEQFNVVTSTTAARLERLAATAETTAASYGVGLKAGVDLGVRAMQAFLELINSIPAPIKALIGVVASLSGAMLIWHAVVLRLLSIWFTLNDGFRLTVRGLQLLSRVKQGVIVLLGRMGVETTKLKVITDALTMSNIRAAAAGDAHAAALLRQGVAAATAAARTAALNLVLGPLQQAWRALNFVIKAFLRFPILRVITLVLVAMRELAKHTDIIHIGWGALTDAFGEFVRVVPGVQEVETVIRSLAAAISSVFIVVALALGRLLNAIALQFRLAAAAGSAFRQLLDPKNWNLSDLRRIHEEHAAAVAQVRAEYEATNQALDELATKKVNAAFGIFETPTDRVMNELGLASEEFDRFLAQARSFFEELSTAGEDLVFNLDATPLEQKLRGIEAEVTGLVERLDEVAAENPVLKAFTLDGEATDDIEQSAYGAMLAVIDGAAAAARDAAIGSFIADLRRDVEQRIVEGMEDGRERLLAETELRERQLEEARDRALRAFAQGSEEYLQVQELYQRLILENRSQYARDLAALEQRIADSIVELERRAMQERIDLMEDGEAKIRAESGMNIQRIRDDIAERLEAVEEGSVEHQRLLQLEGELVALETQRMNQRLSEFNDAIAKRVEERRQAFRASLAELDADLRSLQRAGESDPFVQLLGRQQESLDAARADLQSHLAEVQKALDEETISVEEAAEQRAAIVQRWAAIESQLRQNQLAEQRQYLAEREAAEVAFAQRVQSILDAVAVSREDDPVQRARLEMDAALREVEAWRREQVILAQDNAEQLERIEAEYQARRLQAVVNGNAAVAQAVAQAQRERVRAEVDAATRLAEGVAGVTTHADLQTAAALLNGVRDELLALGAASEELQVVNEALAELSRRASDLNTEGVEDAVERLAALRVEVVDLQDELTLAPAEVERRRQARLFAAWDAEVAEFARVTRARVSDAQEAEALIAQFTEAMELRKTLVVEREARQRAAAEEERRERILDLERELTDARVDAVIAGIEDEAQAEQARYQEARRRRQRDFEAQLTELQANHAERLRLRELFERNEAVLAEQHARRMVAIEARRVADEFEAFAAAQAAALQAVERERERAARDALLAPLQNEVALTEERISQQQELVEGYQAERQALQQRNDELREALGLVPSVRQYAETVEELFGAGLQPQVGRLSGLTYLQEQRDAALELFKQAVRANRPLQERMALLRDLQELNERVIDAGGRGITSDFRQVLEARSELVDTQVAAANAIDELTANEQRMLDFDAAIERTNGSLETLRVTLEGLNTDLRALQEALSEQVFDAATGQFETVEQVAERARQLYLDTIRDLFTSINPELMARRADRRAFPEAFLRALQVDGLEAAVVQASRNLGAAIPEAVIQGLLAAPSPLGGEETLAEHLGIDDVEGAAHELGQRVARLFGGGVEDGAEDDAVTAPLEGALEATAAELEARTEEMGTTAGRGLMQAFADGVLSNRAVLLNAVEQVLQDVRDRLPSSDAKRGPLSDITYSGQALVRTFAGGAASQKRHLARSIDRTFAAARPQVALSAKRYALGGGAGGSLAAGPVTVQVDARSQAAPGPMAFNARRLVGDVERELRVRGLRR